MRSLRRIAGTFALGGLLAAVPVVASDEPPCAVDVRRHCSEVPAGGDRIQGCLKAHEKELSERCRERLDKLATEKGALAAACRWDIARVCSDVVPGGGRVATCLRKREGDLSPECREALRDAGR